MNKKALIWGGVFGLIAPFVGIFVGLQVSVTLGNILAFPVIGLSYILGKPFGTWGGGLMVLAIVFSIIIWALVFGIVWKLLKRS